MSRTRLWIVSAALVGAGGCGGDTTAPVVPVASVTIKPDSVSLVVGESTQLAATVRDASGVVVSGRTVTWSSQDSIKVAVSATGLVTAKAAGRVTITATSEGKSGSAVVISEPPASDFAVADAQITQGIQAADGSVPIVLSGPAAVVNVLLRADRATTAKQRLVLRVFDDSGNLTRSDTVLTGGTLGPNPGYDAPSAQFLVPASVLRPGAAWQVERDPQRTAPDDTAANDVFPWSSRAVLITATVPTLRLRFIPIALTSHGNAMGVVTTGLLPEYLRTLRSVEPLGPVVADIGPPFSTSANFGTPPQGGQSAFWQQVLQELDVARVADGSEPTAHWYGVVVPPQGFNFTAFGGFAYIPSSGQSTGPGTRTAVGVQVNWFNRPTQGRDLVAHELAHNFGRRHSPCGGPSGVDSNYPDPSGTIVRVGHDVYSWESGLTLGFAPVVPASTGDVMGYCFPVWASAYTYRGILEFRQVVTTALSPKEPVIAIRGRITGQRGITLEPVFALRARPTLPDPAGGYQLEGLAEDGRALCSTTFEPATLDHDPEVRHFLVTVPVTTALAESLYAVRVRGPAGETMLRRQHPEP